MIIDDLPIEVAHKVLHYLNVRDLTAVARSSKQLHELTLDSEWWRNLLELYFPQYAKNLAKIKKTQPNYLPDYHTEFFAARTRAYAKLNPDQIRILTYVKEKNITALESFLGETGLKFDDLQGVVDDDGITLIDWAVEGGQNFLDELYVLDGIKCADNNELLLFATQCNQYEELNEFLTGTYDFNIQGVLERSPENSPLYWAAKYGFLDILKLLFAQREMDDYDIIASSMLSAIQRDHFAVVEFLLQEIEITDMEEDIDFFLSSAIQRNNYAIAELLWRKSQELRIGIISAIHNKDLENIKMLLVTLENAEIEQFPLSLALRTQTKEIIDLMLDATFALRAEENQLSENIVKFSDSFGETALLTAARCGNFSVFEKLIEKKFRLDATVEVTSKLFSDSEVEEGDDKESKNVSNSENQEGHLYTCFFDSIVGNSKMEQVLLRDKFKKSVNNLFSDYYCPRATVLYLAVIGGELKIVQWLLNPNNVKVVSDKEVVEETGSLPVINLNAIDHLGNTSLHLAVKEGKLPIAKLLLQKGAAINKKNMWDIAPLHFAVVNQDMVTTELLIEKGADIKSQLKGGITVFHLAAANGDLKLLEFLKSQDVERSEINRPDKTGKTPRSYALQNDYLEVVEWFEAATMESKKRKIPINFLLNQEDAPPLSPAAFFSQSVKKENDGVPDLKRQHLGRVAESEETEPKSPSIV
jgi:ankyrin repeat protein